MSRVTYSPTVTVRLLELSRVAGQLASTGITGDPEAVTRKLEGLLDELADRDPDALVCRDCGVPVPEYAHRRWYHPIPNDHVFDVVCRVCEGRREDVEAETLAFTASR